MKLSLKWLNDHVDVEDFFDNPMKLADRLTDVGLEVEEVESLKAKYKNVVVGKIEVLGKHPDADKLTYCDVNVGDETLKIICGAKNHKQGDLVCVAKIGAVLPGDFKIKKSKIRGVESFGMLCSEKELGLSEESEGILILDSSLKVGEDFSKAFGLDDVIFEINVTPNRADCLSHLGLAREVSCLFKRPLKKVQELKIKTGKVPREIQVKLKDSENCPRYLGRFISGVKVEPSPEWLVKRLESVGMSSINNVVDVTNYIMMNSGQPLHAFDAKHIQGDEVFIEKAKASEVFVSLDGTEFKLDGTELSIRDEKRILALAGVVGGKNSGVTADTENIFLEAAHFVPASVRKTSRSLGIDTDSGYRFSRGTDISRVRASMDEAVHMIQSLAGGTASEEVHESYPKKKEHQSITISHSYIQERLGFGVDVAQIEESFKSLGFEVKSSQGSWAVTPSAFRWDIEIKEDLVEEVGRLIGYDKIPETLPAFETSPQVERSSYKNLLKLKEQFKGFGFHEAIHYNFYSSEQEVSWAKEVANWLKPETSELVQIQNPLSSDLSVMRSSLAPQHISNFIRNWRLGTKSGRIFEIGKEHLKSQGYQESEVLSGAVWSEEDQDQVLKSLISHLTNLFQRWSVSNWRLEPIESNSKVFPSLFHKKLSAKLIVEGKNLGYIYSLHPSVLKDFKVSSSFVGFELDLDLFLKGKPRLSKFKDFSRFPIVERDFSVVVDKGYDFPKISKLIKKSAGEVFKSLALKEEYSDEKMPEGKISVTLKGRFQAKDRTLSEEELKTMQKNILKDLESFS